MLRERVRLCMTGRHAARLAALCLFSIVISATVVFLFRSQGVAESGSTGRTQAQALHPLGDVASGSRLEGVQGLHARSTTLAESLRQASKGRENNFIDEVRNWARKDPEAALAWAQQQPTKDDARKEALTDACFQIAQTDPERAIELAEHFKLDQDLMLTNLARQWATKDLPAAYEWISKQTDVDQRNALGTGLALVWSKTDPAGAAQFVVQQMSSGSSQNDAIIMVLHQWALIDQAGATAWVQQFPEGPVRNTALKELSNMASQP